MKLNAVFMTLENRDLRLYDDGYSETVYRLDRCETYNPMAVSMSSILRLMESSLVWFVTLIGWPSLYAGSLLHAPLMVIQNLNILLNQFL